MGVTNYTEYVSRWQMKGAWRAEMQHWIKLLGLDRSERPLRILDIGCHTGQFMRLLELQGHDVWGVEPNDAARGMAVSKNILPDTRYVKAAAGPETFDMITIIHTLSHVEDMGEFRYGLTKVMAPETETVVIGCNPTYDKLMAPMNAITGYKSDPTYRKAYTPHEIVEELSPVAFQKGMTKVDYYGRLPEWMIQLDWKVFDPMRIRMCVRG